MALRYNHVNQVAFSGIITRNSKWTSASGKVAKARMAISLGKDRSVFKDVVLYADETTGKIADEAIALLEGGTKVVVKGRLDLERNTKEGYEPREQIIVDEISENIPYEDAAAPAPAAEPDDLPADDLTF